MRTDRISQRAVGGVLAVVVTATTWVVAAPVAIAATLPTYDVVTEEPGVTPESLPADGQQHGTELPAPDGLLNQAPAGQIGLHGPTVPAATVDQPANPEAEVVSQLDEREIEAAVAVVPVGSSFAEGLVLGLNEAQPEDALAAEFGTDGLPRSARPDLVRLEADVVPSDTTVRVETIPSGDSAGDLAFALRLDLVDPLLDAGWVDVTLDWSLIAQNFGADYGTRLQLVALPECYLTEPERPECSTPEPLGFELDEWGRAHATLPVDSAVSVPMPKGVHGMARPATVSRGLKMWTSGGGTIIAAVSGGSGAAGTFAATDLAPQGAWNVGQQTGTFSYSIPLDVPPVEAGPVPDLTLRYSSSAVDGRSPAANGQASWVGEGWDLSFGYIERLYANCQIDLPNYPTVVGDNCWRSPFDATIVVEGQTVNLGGVRDRAAYVMSLGGQTYELIPIGNGRFRTSVESGIRVTRLEWKAPTNSDPQGEYFKVQLPDGSVAYFGLGANGNTTRPFANNTNSVLSMPLVGDDAGEPCNGVAFCYAAYRWMLDFEHDASFNATVYSYEKLQNWTYPRGAAPLSIYDMAALPTTIKYGSQWNGDFSQTIGDSQAQVEFETIYRCTTLAVPNPAELSSSATCGAPSASTKALYPDVPLDLLCSSGCSTVTHRTPAFFTTKRLKSVTTSVRVNGNFVSVAKHNIVGTYPLPPESAGATLWLDAVYTTYLGAAGTADDVTTYATTFDGEKYPNRVDWAQASEKLEKRRLTSIRNGFGGVVDVDYVTQYDGSTSNRHCRTQGSGESGFSTWKNDVINNPWNNTWDCNRVPLTHTLLGGSSTTYGIYHKYLVDKVTLVDPIADGPSQEFDYTYVGNPAWAFENDVMYTWAGGVESWSSYRGYSEVLVKTGSGAAASYTRTQFFRGLDGTYQGPSTFDSESVNFLGAATSIPDAPALQGMVAATATGPTAALADAQTRSHTVYGVDQIVTGPRQHNVNFVRTPVAESWVRQPDQPPGTPVWVKARTSTTYDSTLRQPTQQVVDADLATTGNETCSTLGYAWSVRNSAGAAAATFGDPAAWGGKRYIVVPTVGETWWGACGSGGTKTGAWQTYYDESTPGTLSNAELWRGLPTTERTLAEAGVWLESRATYGVRGRISSAQTPSDLANTPQTQTTWTYGDEIDFETVAVTNAAGHTAKTWFDRAFWNPAKSSDANGLFTHYRYDAAGRLVAGWAPVQNAAESDGDLSDAPLASTLPTVSFIYDASAPGLAVRNRPVVVAQAQFTGFNGTTPLVASGVGTARRSYTFYDGFGRVVQRHSVAPDGSGGRLVSVTGYTDTGAVAWATEPFADADPAQFASGLVDVAAADVERHTATSYDWAGRPLVQQVLLGAPGGSGGEVASTSYEYFGLVSTVTAPSEAVTETEMDVLGRLIRQTQVSEFGALDGSLTTEYGYRVQDGTETGDDLGFAEVVVTDPEGNETAFISDLAGRKRTLVDPNSGVSEYSYDAGGRVTSIASATGTLSMEYDVLGRMTWRGVGSSASPDMARSRASWTYDPSGHKGAVAAESSWTATPVGVFQLQRLFEYDSLQRVTSTETKFPSSPLLGELSDARYTTEVAYDVLGQVESTTSTAEREVVPGTRTTLWALPDQEFATSLDVLGRATSLTVTDVGSSAEIDLVTGVSFSPTGQLLSREYGNDVSREYTWDDELGALESVSASFDAGAEILQDDTYVRDSVGRVVSVSDAALGSPLSQCYTYDGFNRLDGAWTDTRTSGKCDGDWTDADQPTGDEGSLGYALDYGYSDSGRINEVWAATLEVAPELDEGVLAEYAYDDVGLPHAVTSVADGATTDSFAYDGAGRMITRTIDDGNSLTDDEMTLVWDESSNLVATGGAGSDRVYVYDTSGQRVAQIKVSELTTSAAPVSATIYVGDAEGTDADSATTDPADVSATRFIAFGGATVAAVTATVTATTWSLLFGDVQRSAQVSMPLVPDPLEETGLEPASTAHTPTRDAYLPYGAERGGTDLAIDRGWLGQYEDTGTGLTYLNARYYDPALGRFLSPDPLMKPGDPRTLDPYRYADNNPIVYTDAAGLWACAPGPYQDECEKANNTNFNKPPSSGSGASSGGSGGTGSGSSATGGSLGTGGATTPIHSIEIDELLTPEEITIFRAHPTADARIVAYVLAINRLRAETRIAGDRNSRDTIINDYRVAMWDWTQRVQIDSALKDELNLYYARSNHMDYGRAVSEVPARAAEWSLNNGIDAAQMFADAYATARTAGVRIDRVLGAKDSMWNVVPPNTSVKTTVADLAWGAYSGHGGDAVNALVDAAQSDSYNDLNWEWYEPDI